MVADSLVKTDRRKALRWPPANSSEAWSSTMPRWQPAAVRPPASATPDGSWPANSFLEIADRRCHWMGPGHRRVLEQQQT